MIYFDFVSSIALKPRSFAAAYLFALPSLVRAQDGVVNGGVYVQVTAAEPQTAHR